MNMKYLVFVKNAGVCLLMIWGILHILLATGMMLETEYNLKLNVWNLYAEYSLNLPARQFIPPPVNLQWSFIGLYSQMGLLIMLLGASINYLLNRLIQLFR